MKKIFLFNTWVLTLTLIGNAWGMESSTTQRHDEQTPSPLIFSSQIEQLPEANKITCAAIHPNGSFVIVGTQKGYLYHIDMDGHVQPKTLTQTLDNRVEQIVFSPNGEFFAAYAPPHKIIVFAHDQTVLKSVTDMPYPTGTIALNNAGDLFFHNDYIFYKFNERNAKENLNYVDAFKINNQNEELYRSDNNIRIKETDKPSTTCKIERPKHYDDRTCMDYVNQKPIATSEHILYWDNTIPEHFFEDINVGVNSGSDIIDIESYADKQLLMAINGYSLGLKTPVQYARCSFWNTDDQTLRASIKFPGNAFLWTIKITPPSRNLLSKISMVISIDNRFFIINVSTGAKNILTQLQARTMGLQKTIILDALMGHYNLEQAEDGSFLLTQNHDPVCDQEWNNDESDFEPEYDNFSYDDDSDNDDAHNNDDHDTDSDDQETPQRPTKQRRIEAKRPWGLL